MMFLPFYLPNSTLLQSPKTGITALVFWILGQVSEPALQLPSLPSMIAHSGTIDCMATTRLPARIPRQIHLRSGSLGLQRSLLCRQCGDTGDYHSRYQTTCERCGWSEEGHLKSMSVDSCQCQPICKLTSNYLSRRRAKTYNLTSNYHLDRVEWKV
jgi:hypothetical protein